MGRGLGIIYFYLLMTLTSNPDNEPSKTVIIEQKRKKNNWMVKNKVKKNRYHRVNSIENASNNPSTWRNDKHVHKVTGNSQTKTVVKEMKYRNIQNIFKNIF